MRLAALAASIPSRRLSAEEIIVAAGGRPAEARAFSKLFGIESVAALDSGSTQDDEFRAILKRLNTDAGGGKPDAVIYVHGRSRSCEKGRADRDALADHPYLQNVRLSLEVDQHNCAGLFWALDMAETCLRSGTCSRILILAGDSLASLPLAARYVPACTLIGDAFIGLVLDRGTGRVQLTDITLVCRPEFSGGLGIEREEMSRFFKSHDQIVLSTLESLAYNHDGECIYPHNVNLLVWRRFCRANQWKLEKVQAGLLPYTGHCYTTDPFLLLHENLATSSNILPGILLSMGFGAYIGACRFTASEDARTCIL